MDGVYSLLERCVKIVISYRIFSNELEEAFPDPEIRQTKAIEKASAWYYVTYHQAHGSESESSESEDDGPKKSYQSRLISFAWIPGKYLADLKQHKVQLRLQGARS